MIHTIFTHARLLVLVLLSMLAVLALVHPALLLDLVVRGGLLAGGVALTLKAQPHDDSIPS